MPGPIGLLGGLEHHAPTMPLDRRILDEVGVFAPEVVILPLASFQRQASAAGALAHEQWTRLGAHARVVLPRSRDDQKALEAVAQADVIVLPGGVPNRLMAALQGTSILDEIVNTWKRGAGLTGSSAGAIDLFERRLNLYLPNPFRLIPGFGLLRGYIVAPHFDRLRVARWYRPFLKQMGGLGVIGLDEATGLVGRVGSMQVLGAGAVTIATTHGADVYRAGSTVDLDLTVPTSPPPVHPIFESIGLAGKESPIPISSRSSSPQSRPVGAMSSPRW
jgi:cyanophycinase-like exopeptidase